MPGILPSVSAPTVDSPVNTQRKPRGLIRSLVLGIVWGWLAAITLEGLRMAIFNNFHVVLDDRVYRSAQLKPNDLRELIQRRSIKTVINLRGCCLTMPWYPDECKVTEELDVSQIDITLSANRFPSRIEIRRLIEALDRSEYPLLLHCRQGADRTGLAAAMVLLLYSDADYMIARAQCGLRYAHVPVLTTKYMDDFFDMYEDWLRTNGKHHAPREFRHWALNEYLPGLARGTVELGPEPRRWKVGETVLLPMRAKNLSRETWKFRPGTYAGISVQGIIKTSEGKLVAIATAGRLHADIPPGESIDLQLAIPAIAQPGKYYLQVDLMNRQFSFALVGEEIWTVELTIDP